ncbi:MAG: UDP-N-acetylmuramoyl-L-alanyl-D-glutamate--2,6-diaminopimelate ligase [Deltaproteobacteria bacterium]|nr:UDP-N-acetylmuramoyl-L-alanyl-D-glutamate--2,6-diaminopimelate ligase [Deltaproteobacteria bacterium]
MDLRTLIAASELLPEMAAGADLSVTVTSVTADSRRVQPGSLFVAVSGARHRGIDFVPAALQAGAVAIVVDALPSAEQRQQWHVPILKVSDARAAVGPLCSAWLDHPSQSLQVIGITGTNGKTTTTVLIAQLLTAAGHKAAALGTIGLWTPDGERPSKLTTPDAEDLQKTLADLRDEGFTHVAIEVSSHALDQHRVAGVRFAAAAWTNLSRDHLDYHGTEDRYAAAKARLFSDYRVPAERAFVNGDDPRAVQPSERGQAQAWSLGSNPAAEHQIEGLRCDAGGLQMVLRSYGHRDLALTAPLVGRHNAENLAAAVLVVRALGVPEDVLQEAARALVAPRGRLQPVANPRGALVVVDYAHTPDALVQVLKALRPLVAPGRRLLVAFGCGGDRDAGKRPQMGKVAAELADFTIATSDNPRSEAPAAILDSIVAGLRQAGAVAVPEPNLTAVEQLGSRRGYWPCVDRAEAIRRAVALTRTGDVLCIAGKGHETTQTIGSVVRHFDDVQEAARWLQPTGRLPGDAPLGFAFDGAAALAVLGGTLLCGSERCTNALCTDSRTVAAGNLFVALPGESFDGGLYVGDALAKGAVGVVCARGRGEPHATLAAERGTWLLEVDDPLRALADLAAAHRNRFAVPVVGITGSNGKTTTKELTSLALSPLAGDGQAVLATQGNHNNRIGVPLTLARLMSQHVAAVVEMGMSIPGEIAELARAARPQLAIVTSVAEAHLLGMGTVQAIADEKFDAVRALPASGVAILPSDEPLLRHLAGELSCKIIHFGRHSGDVHLASAVDVGGLDSDAPWQRFDVKVGSQTVGVRLPGLGVHLADLALAALAAAWQLGVDLPSAAKALSAYRPVGQRMLPERIGPWLVLQDCYNANPRSTETAIDTLTCLPGPRAAVLGSMLELGPREAELHAQVGRHAARRGVDLLIAVGPMAAAYQEGAQGQGTTRVLTCASHAEAAELLARHHAAGTVLIKGSRGARMENVVNALRQSLGQSAHAAQGGC